MRLSDFTHDEIVRARNLASFNKMENHGTAQLREMFAPFLVEPVTDRFDASIDFGVYYNDTFKRHEIHSSRCDSSQPVTPEIMMLLAQEMLTLSADPNLSISLWNLTCGRAAEIFC